MKGLCQFFVHIDDYFEYLLGDPSYLGEDMFIMCMIGRCEIIFNVSMHIINAYNKMCVGHKIKVEWGIGGFEHKWRKTKIHNFFHNNSYHN
jgi:hypothetical protein